MKKIPNWRYGLVALVIGAPVALFSMSVDTINSYRCSKLCEDSGYPYCVYRFDPHKLVDFNGECYCVSAEERKQQGESINSGKL